MTNPDPFLRLHSLVGLEAQFSGTLPNGESCSLSLQSDGSCALSPESKRQARRTCTLRRQASKIKPPAHEVVGATFLEAHSIQIWYMPLSRPSHSSKPTRTLRQSPAVQLASAEDAEAAISSIRRTCCPPSPLPGGGPRRILAIINPTSGRGNALDLFTRQMAPVLEAAGAQVKTLTTQRRGHATQAVLDASPEDFDTIVSVGGDGTMNEVLQGVLQRPDWEAMRKVALVQAPCGSGNALAACTGLWDVPTAAHAVVKFFSTPLDVVSVVLQNGSSLSEAGGGGRGFKRIFSFLSLTYGTISCLDIGTEHLRWMGGNRFLIGALIQILKQPTFRVKIAYLDADRAKNAGVSASGFGTQTIEAAETGGIEMESSATSLMGPPLQHLADVIENATASSSPSAMVPPPFELPAGWAWVDSDEVQLFAACNLPRLDMNFHFAPEATLHSGHLNLILSQGRAGWWKGLAMMTASERGQHMSLVEQHRMVALRLEPLAPEGATWVVVDGEAMPHEPLFAEVHKGLCRVVAAPPPPPAVPS